MNHYTYAFLALDIARERAAEAERHHLETQLSATTSTQTSPVRRVAARLVALVSRGSAWIVRQLDARVADELGRRLAAAE